MWTERLFSYRPVHSAIDVSLPQPTIRLHYRANFVMQTLLQDEHAKDCKAISLLCIILRKRVSVTNRSPGKREAGVKLIPHSHENIFPYSDMTFP
jgi:hypothetical protein